MATPTLAEIRAQREALELGLGSPVAGQKYPGREVTFSTPEQRIKAIEYLKVLEARLEVAEAGPLGLGSGTGRSYRVMYGGRGY